MGKYKVGDKIVMVIADEIGATLVNKGYIDNAAKPLYAYTEPLEAKIRRQETEITKLLAENEKLKKYLEYYHTGTGICDIESARITGQNEAWELARKIILNNGYSIHDLYEIFGYADSQTLMKNHTYPEAATKVEEWEKANEEIKKGDIIRNKYDTSSNFCVTDIDCDGHLYGVGRNGLIYSNQDPEYWKKTGHHIDIDGFLKQIGGAE